MNPAYDAALPLEVMFPGCQSHFKLRFVFSQGEEGLEHANALQMLPDDQYYAVELYRGTRGFGFSIRGGQEFQNMPLFVLRIADNGPAHQDGRLQVR